MHREFRATAAILLLAVAACNSTAPENPARMPAPAIAAAYAGGEIRLDEVEAEIASARTPACVQAKGTPGGGSLESLIPCYREVAETLAIERLVLADVADLDQALEGLEDDFDARRDAALLEGYYRRLAEGIELNDEDLARLFGEHKEDLATPRRFTLYNIFRRHRDPADPEQTMAYLRQLKSRIDAGETFRGIARDHSDSETRLRDGLVGQVSDSQLPPRLRAVAAVLESGQVSEPIAVQGGAVLIAVEGVAPAIEPTLEGSRAALVRLGREQALHQAVDARTAHRQIPETAVVLSDEDLLEQLDAADPERLIFDLGGQQMTVSEFRRRTGQEPSIAVLELPPDQREGLLQFYAQLKRRRLLLIDLLESSDAADRALREQIQQPLHKERLTRLVDELLQEQVRQSADHNSASLERYFSDNSHHYQSPLKFKLHAWTLPFDQNPAVQLASMERLRDEMAQGDYDLANAAERLGGTVEDLGWRDFEALEDLPDKARAYLLQATPGGYSVPYQQDDALHLLWVEAREAPRPLAYGEVKGRVRNDYLERFERTLFEKAVDDRLTAVGFVFSADNVRALLLPPPALAGGAAAAGPR